MNIPPPLEKLNEALEHEFKIELDYKYGASLENARLYQIQVERIQEQTTTEYQVGSVYFSWLLDLSLLHHEYSVYAGIKLKDKALANKHIALSAEYGFYCLDYGSKSCECFEGIKPFIIINKAVFMMSNLLMVNDFDKFETIGKHLISSLNGENCIIKKGNPKSTISWFVLKLFSLYSGEEIKLHPLLCPKETTPYNEVLEKWDTQDSQEVEKFIHFLCDEHISQGSLDYEESRREVEAEEENSLKYKELFMVSMYTYPLEVFVFLKLREKQGLNNPKEFSHPLMNTSVARMFLELDEPLPQLKSVPYTKALLTRLKEKCPAIELQGWMN